MNSIDVWGSQTFVAAPIYYRDYKGKNCEFRELDNSVQSAFQSLLQYTSPSALLEEIPVYREFEGLTATFQILNYTRYVISFHKSAYFSIYSIEIKIINAYILLPITGIYNAVIAYPLKNRDNICLEIKMADYYLRHFVTVQQMPDKTFLNQYWMRRSEIEKPLKPSYADVRARRYVSLDISTDESMQSLIQRMPKEAFFKLNPSLHLFYGSPLNDAPCFQYKILNYTDQTITIDIFGCLLINDFNAEIPIKEKILAYHLEGNSELICINRDEKISDQYYVKQVWEGESIVWGVCNRDEFNLAMQNVRKTRAVHILAAAHYDAKCSFYAPFPIEVIHQIIQKYLL